MSDTTWCDEMINEHELQICCVVHNFSFPLNVFVQLIIKTFQKQKQTPLL
jgi:hypothetical protein